MTEAADQTIEKPTTNTQREEIAKGWVDRESTDKTTVEEYCKQKGISTASLYGWIKKFGLNPDAKTKGKPTAKAAPAPTTIEGMEAAIKRQQDALAQQKKDYVKLLRSEVTRLKAELGKATQKYEEITEGMSQAELDELHNSDSV